MSSVLSFFLIYLLIMLLQLSHFHPFTQLHPAHARALFFVPELGVCVSVHVVCGVFGVSVADDQEL